MISKHLLNWIKTDGRTPVVTVDPRQTLEGSKVVISLYLGEHIVEIVTDEEGRLKLLKALQHYPEKLKQKAQAEYDKAKEALKQFEDKEDINVDNEDVG